MAAGFGEPAIGATVRPELVEGDLISA